MFKMIKKAYQNLTAKVASGYQAGKAKVSAMVATATTSVAALVATKSYAVGPDFTTLTTGVDFSTVGPALLLIAVAISGVYVIWKGAKMILSAVKSA